MQTSSPPRRRPLGPAVRWQRAIPLIGIGFVAANVLWRSIRYALAFPIWGDEAFVIMNLIHRDLAGLLSPLEYGQVVPLLFMWAQYGITQVLGYSENALRLLPFLTGVASMVLFWRFAGSILNRREALLAVAILAASYYPVRHAAEVKPYAGDLFFSLLLMALAWAVYRRPGSVLRWLGLIAAAAIGVWCSYPVAFIAGGVGLLLLYLLVREPSARHLAWAAVYVLVLGASFMMMVRFYANPQAHAGWVPGSQDTIDQWGEGFPPVREFWKLPVWFLDVHTGNMMAYPVGGRSGGSTATFLLVLAGIVSLCQRRRYDLLILLLGAVPFALAAAAMHRYPYGTSARLALHFAPAICLVAGVGLMGLLRRFLQPALLPAGLQVAAVVFGGILVVGIVRDVVKPYKTRADQESRRIVRWLAESTGPGDQWISFNVPDPNVAHADNMYLRGGHGARHRFYLTTLAPVPLNWAPLPQDAVPEGLTGRTWLIVYKDERAPFPHDALGVYLETLTARLGAGRLHAFQLDGKEWVDVWEFPAQQDGEIARWRDGEKRATLPVSHKLSISPSPFRTARVERHHG